MVGGKRWLKRIGAVIVNVLWNSSRVPHRYLYRMDYYSYNE